MIAIFLLPIWALAPIRDVVCFTGDHTSFVHSVDPFENRKYNVDTGRSLSALQSSNLISSLINQRLVALSLSLTISISVDNSWSDFQSAHLHTWSLVSFEIGQLSGWINGKFMLNTPAFSSGCGIAYVTFKVLSIMHYSQMPYRPTFYTN